MTRTLTRLLAALAFLALAAVPSLAQNYNIPANAIAIGRGTNISAFTSIAPAATSKFLVGGGTSSIPVFQTMSGDCSVVAGVVTCAKANGVTMPSSGTSGGVPYYSSTSAVSSSALLTANQLVVGGGAATAPATLGSLGTATTLLHGNAAGAPTFGAVVSGDLNITGTTCTNQFVSAISAAAAGTCTTDTLAGPQHANQGTTTTVLHGNASGNPSFGAVAIGSDVSGLGTGVGTALAVNVGSAGAPVLFNGAGGTPSAINLANGNALPVSGITASTSTALGVGSVELGAASDTTLARGSAGVLTVEGVTVPTISSTSTLTNKSLTAPVITGTADVQQALLLSGDISPTQIVANTNDYAPTGFSTATTLRLNTDASRNITGLAGGAGGRVIVIHNVGGFNIVLVNQDAGSTAANRFLFGGDMTLAADTSVTIKYDTTSSRWRAITSPGAGGGGGGVTSVTVAAGLGLSSSGTCTITTSGTCTLSAVSYTPTATAAGTTTLTSSSTKEQYFTGSTTQTVALPVTSTLALGWQFHIVNNSTGKVTITSSGGSPVIALASGDSATVTVILTSGTTAASWASEYKCPVTQWVDYTPTATGFGTITSVKASSRRVCGNLEERIKFTSGTATGVEARMTMGFNGTDNNVTSDSTIVNTIQAAGTALVSFNGTATTNVLIESGLGYFTFGQQSSGANALAKATGTTVLGSTSTMSIIASVPISTWN